MGIIRQKIEIIGLRKSKNIEARFDSGAFRNYLRNELEDEDTPEDIGFHTYEGKDNAILANQVIAVCERVRFEQLIINGKIINNPMFEIMEDMLEYAIIGAETMQELGITVDFKNDKMIF